MAASLVLIDFGFELIKKKRLTAKWTFTSLNMYSLRLDTQEYEELTSEMFLYKIIS